MPIQNPREYLIVRASFCEGRMNDYACPRIGTMHRDISEFLKNSGVHPDSLAETFVMQGGYMPSVSLTRHDEMLRFFEFIHAIDGRLFPMEDDLFYVGSKQDRATMGRPVDSNKIRRVLQKVKIIETLRKRRKEDPKKELEELAVLVASMNPKSS